MRGPPASGDQARARGRTEWAGAGEGLHGPIARSVAYHSHGLLFFLFLFLFLFYFKYQIFPNQILIPVLSVRYQISNIIQCEYKSYYF
jgi:hypothetical protein